MAQAIKLSMTLGTAAGDAPQVHLEVDRGLSPFGEELTLDLDDLGIGPDFDPARRELDQHFAFAPPLWPQIRELVKTALAGEPVLWLQLAPPVGPLAAMPWEAMLEPIVGRVPIVRIPNFSLLAHPSADPIDFVICLAEPEMNDRFDGGAYVSRLVRSLLAVRPSPPRIHVFTDAHTYPTLLTDPELWSHGTRVVLHAPPCAHGSPRKNGNSPPDAARYLRTPGLIWIVDEMREATADIVHFVSHAEVWSGQSSLAFAGSWARGGEPSLARSAGPPEIAAFLDLLGAWSVGFTSLPGDFSAMGLRQFVDDVARLRAGPVLHHDAWHDQTADGLAAAYASLLFGRPPGCQPEISMYAHPGLFTATAPPDGDWANSFADHLMRRAPGTPANVSAVDPAWTMSTRRYLEQTVAQLFPEEVRARSPAPRRRPLRER